MAQDTQTIADDMRSAVIKAAREDPKRRFEVVDYPSPQTLVLELALVEMVPNKVGWGALGLASMGILLSIGLLLSNPTLVQS